MFRLSCDLGAECRTVVSTESVAEDINLAAIMEARDTLHQMRRRVVTKVRGHVADTQPPTDFFGVFVRRFV